MRSGSRPITVSRAQVSAGRVAVRIDAGSARKYLRSGWFLVDYGDLDVSRVDPAVLVIPALGTVLPIAYASGTPVVVDSVDARYADAAQDLSTVWPGIYPRFTAERLSLLGRRVETSGETGGGAMALYSGGLDSTATLLVRREVTSVLSVWGADVPAADTALWSALDEMMDQADVVRGLRRVTARTNFREFPVERTLVHDFLEPGDSWWARVHHGMGIIGLAAPAATALRLPLLIVPASYSPAFDEPNGSMPVTDRLQRWSATEVDHEGFELSRQGKIDQRLAPHVRAGGEVELAVCYQPGRAGGGRALNCGQCEKCLRTAAGLLAAGVEPSEVGLGIDDATYDHWSGIFQRGAPVLHSRSLPFWLEIRSALLSGDRALSLTGPQGRFLAALRASEISAAFHDGHTGSALAREGRYWVTRLLPEPVRQRASTVRAPLSIIRQRLERRRVQDRRERGAP